MVTLQIILAGFIGAMIVALVATEVISWIKQKKSKQNE